MKTLVSAAFVITILASYACSSTGGGSSSGGGPVARASDPAPSVTPTMSIASSGPAQTRTQAPVAKNGAKSPEVSVLKLSEAEVPAQVRAIEKLIDRRSALLADNVRIEVSKNYEWDVSLTGDKVLPHRPENGGTFSEAEGNPRAYFRNLDIRARDRITIWRSGLGVTPFIRIQASGAVSYIDTDEAGNPRVKRSGACRINNANIAFEEQILGIPTAEELSAKPAGQQGK